MIRPETANDLDAIREIHVAAFPTAAESELVDALREAGNLDVSLIAIDDGSSEVVGHIAFSPVTIEGGEALAGTGLAPVAVLPEFQGKGVGQQLIEAGLLTCEESGADFVVVLGDPNYYSRFGFQPATNFEVGNEYGVGDEFMVIEFTGGCLTGGTAKYCQQFEELD